MSRRYLLLLARLDLYTERYSDDEAQVLLARGWVDVTGDPVHEQLHHLYQAQK